MGSCAPCSTLHARCMPVLRHCCASARPCGLQSEPFTAPSLLQRAQSWQPKQRALVVMSAAASQPPPDQQNTSGTQADDSSAPAANMRGVRKALSAQGTSAAAGTAGAAGSSRPLPDTSTGSTAQPSKGGRKPMAAASRTGSSLHAGSEPSAPVPASDLASDPVMLSLAQQLCDQYQGLGDTPEEVVRALVVVHGIRPRAVSAVGPVAGADAEVQAAPVFETPAGKQLRGEQAVAEELLLQLRQSCGIPQGMLYLAAHLLQAYKVRPECGTTRDELARWLMEQGVKCVGKRLRCEEKKRSDRQRYKYALPGNAETVGSVRKVAKHFNFDSRRQLSKEEGQALLISQLREWYQDGPGSTILTDTAHMAPTEAHAELESRHGVRYSSVRTWNDDGTPRSCNVRLHGLDKDLSTRHVALSKLGLVKKPPQHPFLPPSAGMDMLVHRLTKGRYVVLLPGGAVQRIDSEQGWREFLAQRGVQCHSALGMPNGKFKQALFYISHSSHVLNMEATIAALGLVLPSQAPTLAATQAEGMWVMAAALVPLWEEMGADQTVEQAVKVLQWYGVECWVHYYRTSGYQGKMVMMGAFFVPAASDVQSQAAAASGQPPLPNSVIVGGRVVGRLVRNHHEMVAALGLTRQRRFPRALCDLVRQLRAEYQWPDVSSEEEGIQVLRANAVEPRYTGKTHTAAMEEVNWAVAGRKRPVKGPIGVANALKLKPL